MEGASNCWDVLFCSVLFCSVLFCSVLFCSVLFCSVLFCSVLFCSILFYSVLFCSILFCSVLFPYLISSYRVLSSVSLPYLILLSFLIVNSFHNIYDTLQYFLLHHHHHDCFVISHLIIFNHRILTPWMAGGTQLWDAIKSHKPTILTGTVAKAVERVFEVSLIYY